MDNEYKKQWVRNNPDKRRKHLQKYYNNNKDKISEYNKQYRIKNKDKMKEQNKEYRKNNKDKAKEYRIKHKDELKEFSKQYRENNKEQLVLKNKIYLENNKDEINKRRKLNYMKNIDKIKEYRILHRELMLISHYKYNDKKRGFICDLTEEWTKENITSKPCIYCGETKDIGCDRIDNSKGHTKDNVIPCCLICNQTRMNNYSFEEMIRLGLVIRQIKQDRLKNGL
jgi:hypothetical protein